MIPGADTRRRHLVPRRHAGDAGHEGHDLRDLHPGPERHEAPAPVDVVRRPEPVPPPDHVDRGNFLTPRLYPCPPFDPWESATAKLSM